MRNLWT